MTRLAAALLLALLAAEEKRESPVGLPARIDQLVLPGTEVEPVPGDEKSPVVLRVVAVWPHGTAFRYDLEWYGLDPGAYDLAKLLRRKDATSADDLPPIPVRVVSTLPPGRALPHRPGAGEVETAGGYRIALIAAAALWAAGLAALLFLRRKRVAAESGPAARPATLAEKLRPLVLRATRGELSPRERAELELRLIAYWRKRRGLERETPEAALAILKSDASAGPLLVGLEDWLHRPSPPAEVDVAKLLEPYREVTDAAFDEASASGARA